MSIVRKLTNHSQAIVPVDVDENTRLFLEPGGKIENRNVSNLGSIRQFCKVEEDLGEVSPIKEGIQYLKG